MTQAETLTLLWRGHLSGCNYDCHYCPFAKQTDTRETLAADQQALERFADWAQQQSRTLSILITPWGEGLIRRYYRDVMQRLSHTANVDTIAIQTNLSCSIDWVTRCDLSRIALWTTYHPGETPRGNFLEKIHHLQSIGTRYSVGVVAIRESFNEIEALRKDLPPEAYLWINAEESLQGKYTNAEIERLVAIDPLFELNNRTYVTKGLACYAGETVLSILPDGTARRCHFVDEALGNIYAPDFFTSLQPRTCPQAICNCHIGYSHLKEFDAAGLYGTGRTERRASIPSRAAAQERITKLLAQVSISG